VGEKGRHGVRGSHFQWHSVAGCFRSLDLPREPHFGAGSQRLEQGEGRKEERKEERKGGRKEGRKGGRKGGRKEGRKGGRKGGRKEGRKEGRGLQSASASNSLTAEPRLSTKPPANALQVPARAQRHL
jgi:hypothetical protein